MASVSNDGNDFDYEDVAKASDNDMDLLWKIKSLTV